MFGEVKRSGVGAKPSGTSSAAIRTLLWDDSYRRYVSLTICKRKLSSKSLFIQESERPTLEWIHSHDRDHYDPRDEAEADSGDL
jgi:hypothetical protein